MTKGLVAAIATAFAMLCTNVAPAQIGPPILGVVRSASGEIRPVQGVHANVTYQQPIAAGTIAASFSDTHGLIATRSRISLVKVDGTEVARWSSDETNPILDIGSGPETAIAWLPGVRRLLYWQAGQFQITPQVSIDSQSRVTSVRAMKALAEFETTSQNETASTIAVDLADGTVRSVMAHVGVRGSVFSAGKLLIFLDAQRWVVEAPDGSRRDISIPEKELTFTRMAKDWLHLQSSANTREWALHITDTKLELSELPVSGTKPVALQSAVTEIRQ